MGYIALTLYVTFDIRVNRALLGVSLLSRVALRVSQLRESVVLYTFFVVSNTTATKRTSRRAADGPDGSAQVRCDHRSSRQPLKPRAASCHVPARCPGSAEPMATSQLLVAGCGCQGLNTTDSRQAGLLGLELAGDEVRVSAQPAIALTRSHRLCTAFSRCRRPIGSRAPATSMRGLQCRRAVVYTTPGCLAHHAGRRKRSCCVVYGRRRWAAAGRHDRLGRGRAAPSSRKRQAGAAAGVPFPILQRDSVHEGCIARAT